jgi:amino acid permease
MAAMVKPENFSLGGHVGLVFGWLIPCCFVGFVALSMAELASSMPYVSTHISLIIANDDVERALVFTISLQKWLLRSMHL